MLADTRIKERFAAFDVQVYRIGHHRVHNVPEITLNQPGRDERIDEFCRFIEELGKAGIYYNTYAHMATGIWSSGETPGRGGTTARVFDPKTAVGSWNGAPLSHHPGPEPEPEPEGVGVNRARVRE